MRNVNKVTLMGHLTADPQLHETKTGIAVSTVRMATNYQKKDQEGTQTDNVEFHDVTCWGTQAENVCKFLKKGSPVFIEGRIRTANWVTKEGEHRYKKEVVAEIVNFLDTKSGTPKAFDQEEKQAEKITEQQVIAAV